MSKGLLDFYANILFSVALFLARLEEILLVILQKNLDVDANRALGFWTLSVVLQRPTFDTRDD